mmetsp:Transcript_2543/g.7916  ORF Transcript_2543/g.7916 Transcript_2543/m.7916 type:complete len:90 (-) Transcript_2543:592-861(-)
MYGEAPEGKIAPPVCECDGWDTGFAHRLIMMQFESSTESKIRLKPGSVVAQVTLRRKTLVYGALYLQLSYMHGTPSFSRKNPIIPLTTS